MSVLTYQGYVSLRNPVALASQNQLLDPYINLMVEHDCATRYPAVLRRSPFPLTYSILEKLSWTIRQLQRRPYTAKLGKRKILNIHYKRGAIHIHCDFWCTGDIQKAFENF